MIGIKNNIHPIAMQLMWIRGLRSIGQGAMVVDLTLYLQDLHWSGVAIGGVTSGAGIMGAMLILMVGLLSDRMGRKPFLLIYEVLTLMCSLAASVTSAALLLMVAIVIVGFGRGQSGAAGPFSPAEQALLAQYVSQSDRGRVFSLNNAIGFIGMAIGSIVGGLPDLIHGSSPLENYRPVFLTIAVFSLLCILIILRIPEVKNRSANEPIHEEQARTEAQQEKQVRKKENHALTVLALVNVLNGLAVGLTGPMMAYWFRLRYGASTGAIGATLSISFLLTGIFSILSGRIAARMGMVKSVTWMRIIGSICMLALAFMPTFTLASLFFILRNAINRATQGNRNALSASLTRDKRRGLATSINALSMRLPSSIGPTISGYLFDADLLSLPLILTAVLQLANAGLYQWVFGRWDQQTPSPSHEKE